MDYAVWNTLHDGGVESVIGNVPGDVSVLIHIPYLCQKLPTDSKALEIRLRNCTRFEYEPFEGDVLTNPTELAACGIEILSADQKDGFISVVCVGGSLRLIYKDVEIRLLDGKVISQAELEDAAVRYWADWSTKHASK
ncbi:MAG TPA: hypothetical protein VHM90_21890 [Phycisphaerae bacterium]|nr:hypothetical protein [Phycisphaerae bacterium]